jgi:methionyl-tRNA synthetase
MNKITKFISAPIFYVNSKPHIGHLYTALICDTYKRWYDLKEQKTMFSIGTDEHGLKVQQAAQLNQMAPIDFCNKISQEFLHLFKTANIKHTDFIRTTEERHKKTVHSIWNKLLENGFIYKGEYAGWYSISDEQFVPAAQTYTQEIDGKVIHFSTETSKPVEWTTELNYKFKLAEFKPKLLKWLHDNPKGTRRLNSYFP